MSKDKNPANKSNKTKKEPESKVVKFKRVVTPRVNKALKAIKLVGNCSTKDYSYSHDDKQKIIDALFGAIQKLDEQFSGGHAADNTFEL